MPKLESLHCTRPVRAGGGAHWLKHGEVELRRCAQGNDPTTPTWGHVTSSSPPLACHSHAQRI